MKLKLKLTHHMVSIVIHKAVSCTFPSHPGCKAEVLDPVWKKMRGLPCPCLPSHQLAVPRLLQNFHFLQQHRDHDSSSRHGRGDPRLDLH